MDKAGEALVPDLKQYYGIDLRDLFSEDNPLSPRWALMHANNLPLASATSAELRGGPQFRGWDLDRYIAARTIDVVQALKYITLLAHRDPDARIPDPPDPFPTPDQPDPKKQRDLKPGSFASIAAALLTKSKQAKAKGGA